MTIIKTMAHELVEAERMRIRAWDLQRREKASPHAEPIADEQVDRSAALLEELAPHLPSDEQEDVGRLVKVVRTRLALASGPAVTKTAPPSTRT